MCDQVSAILLHNMQPNVKSLWSSHVCLTVHWCFFVNEFS